MYAGLPIALALIKQGKSVHLANWRFAELYDPGSWVAPGVAAVRADTVGNDDYFPERTLARWLAAHDLDQPVYTFAPTGVRPLRAAYNALAERLDLDAVVLVDGGTDIWLRGDEAGLGTPLEDITSLAALAHLDAIPTRLVTSLGFGIDAHHGVNHTDVLQNLHALTAAGSYLGAFSIPADSNEAAAYLDAVQHARTSTPGRPSIVNGQIAAALHGSAIDDDLARRTSGSELFINPLMTIYFAADLDGLAAANLYLDTLADTDTTREVALALEAYRYDATVRPPVPFPH